MKNDTTILSIILLIVLIVMGMILYPRIARTVKHKNIVESVELRVRL